MPEVSRFFGIVIQMFFREHNPPHFHVRYQGKKAVFTIRPFGLDKGEASPHTLALVKDWVQEHEAELLENWDRARNGIEPLPIAPLE